MTFIFVYLNDETVWIKTCGLKSSNIFNTENGKQIFSVPFYLNELIIPIV